MKVFGKIIEYLLYALLLFMALLVLASALPIPGGLKTFVVRSGSMEPKIKTGSVVVVWPKGEYKVGDVVTYGPNTKLRVPTTHRIISESGTVGRKFFLTKGDANNTPDVREISQLEIIGKVVLDIPYFGYVVAAAQKPIGFAVIVGVPALLIIGDQLIKIFREIKVIRKKKEDQPSIEETVKKSKD
ncbi:MAG: signal peptidase I [Candidatus Doudnabacteria bacterium]